MERNESGRVRKDGKIVQKRKTVEQEQRQDWKREKKREREKEKEKKRINGKK